MSSTPVVNAAAFFARAEELGFLSGDTREEATQAANTTQASPADFALRQGWLSAAQIEIVHTLLNPREAIPGYEILGLLGFGGMGVVYRATQLALQRPVALKTILVHQLGKGQAVQRFEQEAVTIGRLVHPHIVAAYDFGRQAGRLYLAMELVNGVDADTWVRDSGPLPEAFAWRLARQVASGLAHAAALGVVHRDIKPANLLLVTPPAGFELPPGVPLVKIADFGLAWLSEADDQHTRLTSQGSTLGSPHYMAPEQLEAREVDQRTDIYALGATVFHCLTGNPPWHGLGLSQLMAKKLSGDVPELGNLNQPLQPESVRLLNDMLAHEPSARPADYAELLRRIDIAIRDCPAVDTTTISAHVPRGGTPATQPTGPAAGNRK